MSSSIKPDHYKSGAFDVIAFCQMNDIDFCCGNVIKYVVRHKEKNGLEDLEKAQEYLNRMKKHYYEV